MKPDLGGEMGALAEEKLEWEVDPQQQVTLVEMENYKALPDKAQENCFSL